MTNPNFKRFIKLTKNCPLENLEEWNRLKEKIEKALEIVDKFYRDDSCGTIRITLDEYRTNQDKQNEDKAKKWDNLMTHTKWEGAFGCKFHFDLKEANRRNQFLQSENQELKQNEKIVDEIRKYIKMGRIIQLKSVSECRNVRPEDYRDWIFKELQSILNREKK